MIPLPQTTPNNVIRTRAAGVGPDVLGGSDGGCSVGGQSSDDGQNAPPPHLIKTKMCKFFKQGICARAGDCLYAHSEEDLRQDSFYRTRFCKALLQTGKCNNPGMCGYAHTKAELRRAPDASKGAADLRDAEEVLQQMTRPFAVNGQEGAKAEYAREEMHMANNARLVFPAEQDTVLRVDVVERLEAMVHELPLRTQYNLVESLAKHLRENKDTHEPPSEHRGREVIQQIDPLPLPVQPTPYSVKSAESGSTGASSNRVHELIAQIQTLKPSLQVQLIEVVANDLGYPPLPLVQPEEEFELLPPSEQVVHGRQNHEDPTTVPGWHHEDMMVGQPQTRSSNVSRDVHLRQQQQQQQQEQDPLPEQCGGLEGQNEAETMQESIISMQESIIGHLMAILSQTMGTSPENDDLTQQLRQQLRQRMPQGQQQPPHPLDQPPPRQQQQRSQEHRPRWPAEQEAEQQLLDFQGRFDQTDILQQRLNARPKASIPKRDKLLSGAFGQRGAPQGLQPPGLLPSDNMLQHNDSLHIGQATSATHERIGTQAPSQPQRVARSRTEQRAQKGGKLPASFAVGLLPQRDGKGDQAAHTTVDHGQETVLLL